MNSGKNENLNYWKNCWTQNKTEWHRESVNKWLLKYYKLATGKSFPSEQLAKESVEFKENSLFQWLIPLCGKTLDIAFLLSLGYKVFAVEGVLKAIETLGSESDLDLEWDEKQNLFVGVDERLKIYYGDLFQCPIENFGPFDYVWDHGSLIALEYHLREAYKSTMQRALKSKNGRGKYHNFHYLLEGVEYDKAKYGGSLSEIDVETIYSDWANVKLLEKLPLPTDDSVTLNVGIGKLDELIYLITPK